MIVLGLTGSIGMGKSTMAARFRARGIPVFDADACVRDLYRGGPLVRAIDAAFPGVVEKGAINRDRLAARVFGDTAALRRLEALVHPAVAEARAAFLERARKSGAELVVVDIPLLYETARADEVDAVLVVSAAPAVQRARVLTRPGMTEERFEAILARQMADAEKRRRADFVIETDQEETRITAALEGVIAALTKSRG